MARIEDPPLTLPLNIWQQALENLRRFGSSDFYPQSPDYDALSVHWPYWSSYLASLNLINHKASGKRNFAVPKSLNDYRITAIVEAIDSIIYTALALHFGARVEQRRIPAERNVVFSHRFDPDNNGRLFSPSPGWQEFTDARYFRADRAECSFVVNTDINDYYNSISLHRVENILENCGIPRSEAEMLERFLTQLNNKSSRGIPIGPAASALFAECALIDLDNHLSQRFQYVRFIDDMSFFCSSRREANEILEELSKYLYSVERLSLNSQKTRVYSADEFQARFGFSDEEREDTEHTRRTETRINELTRTETVTEIDGYSGREIEVEVEILEEDPDTIRNDELRDLLRTYVTRVLNGRSRVSSRLKHAVRRATQLRSDCLIDLVIDNLNKFTYIFGDVVRYLEVVARRLNGHQISVLLRFARESEVHSLEYIKEWTASLFYKLYVIRGDVALKEFVQNLDESYAFRYKALIAIHDRDRSWFLPYRESWSRYPEEERRMIIYASSVLGTTERRFFLNAVREIGSEMDKGYGILADNAARRAEEQANGRS